MTGPCLCGDPECGRCFPTRGRASGPPGNFAHPRNLGADYDGEEDEEECHICGNPHVEFACRECGEPTCGDCLNSGRVCAECEEAEVEEEEDEV